MTAGCHAELKFASSYAKLQVTGGSLANCMQFTSEQRKIRRSPTIKTMSSTKTVRLTETVKAAG